MFPVRLGILWMLISSVCFLLMSICIKIAATTASVPQTVFFRSLVSLVLLFIIAKRKQVSLWGSKTSLLWVRGILGFLGLICYYYGLSRIPLGNITILASTYTIWIALLSNRLTQEKTEKLVVFLLPFFFIGILLIAKPKWSFEFLPALAGILTGFILGVVHLTIRNLRKTDRPTSIVFYFVATSVLGSFPMTVFYWNPLNLTTLIYLLASGFLAIAAQLFMTRAYREEPASTVSLFGYASPVLAYIVGIIFFKEIPDIFSTLGAILIVVCGLIAARYTQSQPTERISV